MTRPVPASAMLALACAVLASCHAGAHLSEPDADKIRAVVDAASRLAVAPTADLDAYVKLYYTEGAQLLAPNRPTAEGRAAIRAFMASLGSLQQMKLSIVSIEGMNDLACVHGTYALTWTPPGASVPQGDKGKYVEIWKRQADGAWKVTHDIFNSDLPPPGLGVPTGPAKPGSAEMERLAFFVGRWDLAGENKASPLGPAGKSSGTIQCDWFPGGFQIVCLGDASGPAGRTHGLAVYRWDPDAGAFSYYGIDSTGFGGPAKGTVTGKTWTFLFDMKAGGKPLRLRSTTVEESAAAMTWKDEISTGGGPYALLGEGRLQKRE